jgi:hypothetical protein
VALRPEIKNPREVTRMTGQKQSGGWSRSLGCAISLFVAGTLCLGLGYVGWMFSEGGGNPAGFLVYAAVAFVLGVVILIRRNSPAGPAE